MKDDSGRLTNGGGGAGGGVLPVERALEPIDVARRRAEQERREVVAELDAFVEFRARVEAVEATRALVASPRGLLAESGETARDDMANVREGYRETVMSVDHYDRVYGESLESNLEAEFGPDIASGICDGGDAAFTPGFKRALLVAIERNVEERRSFLDGLDRERESLANARSDLSDVVDALSAGAVRSDDRRGDRSNGGGSGRRTRTLSPPEASDRIRSVVRRRQRLVHSRVSAGRADGHDLCGYLYHDETWTYPVLSAATSLHAQVRTAESPLAP
ncbi:MAG: hypothetical protein ABEJ28_13200 [Salinigranum sp.]